VLERYRLGQGPRLSAAQQERAALVAHIQRSVAQDATPDQVWAWLHAPQSAAPFEGESPLYYLLENGLPGLREVARHLQRRPRPRGESEA
jgi:hypothetical protein